MAVSPDQLRMIFFQGHPEYDINSLLKEYKREVLRYFSGDLHSLPPFPEHYFSDEAMQLASSIAKNIESNSQGTTDLLEQELEAMLDNTWGDTAKAVINNWLGLVYQVTNLDRTKLFMQDIDPNDPLQMHNQE